MTNTEGVLRERCDCFNRDLVHGRMDEACRAQWLHYWSIVSWFQVTTDLQGYANRVGIDQVIAALEAGDTEAMKTAGQELRTILWATPKEIERWHEAQAVDITQWVGLF